jgi:hypothetical protein
VIALRPKRRVVATSLVVLAMSVPLVGCGSSKKSGEVLKLTNNTSAPVTATEFTGGDGLVRLVRRQLATGDYGRCSSPGCLVILGRHQLAPGESATFPIPLTFQAAAQRSLWITGPGQQLRCLSMAPDLPGHQGLIASVTQASRAAC